MNKNILIVDSKLGFSGVEEITREKGIFTAARSLIKSNYNVFILTERKESLLNNNNLKVKIIYQNIDENSIKNVVENEQIDDILPTFAGYSGLIYLRTLYKQHYFDAHDVNLLNVNEKNILLSISRNAFYNYIDQKGFRLVEHQNIKDIDEAESFATNNNFPILIKPNLSYKKGHWTTVNNFAEIANFFDKYSNQSAVDSYEIERSINGLQGVTMTTVRDKFDNTALIFAAEDFDSFNVHSTDSISVTPVVTMTDEIFQRLRNAVLRLTSLMKVIGICTFHLAVDLDSDAFYILETAPYFQDEIFPLIESTGYPIFEVISQLGLGRRIQSIPTLSGDKINAAVELTPDHITARFPFWQTKSYNDLNVNLGARKTSIGNIIVNGNNLETVIMKGFRALDMADDIFINHSYADYSDEDIEMYLFHSNVQRLFAVCEALDRGFDIKEVQSFSKYNVVFLKVLKHLLDLNRLLAHEKGDLKLFIEAKRYGFSDFHISKLWEITTSQTKELTDQTELNNVDLETPALFSIDNGAVVNHYSSFLHEKNLKKNDYQIELTNFQNSNSISNYEMMLLTHNLIFNLKTDGFSVSENGNLLSNIDSAALTDFYTDYNFNKSFLYNSIDRLNISINTVEDKKQQFTIDIYSTTNYSDLLKKGPIQEIVFVQDKNDKLWLSSPIETSLSELSPTKMLIRSMPGKHTPELVTESETYIHDNLSDIKYGTLLIQNGKVVRDLHGFTNCIGMVQQINSNFINVLCLVYVNADSVQSNNQMDYFGRQISLFKHKNGIYTTKLKYFDKKA